VKVNYVYAKVRDGTFLCLLSPCLSLPSLETTARPRYVWTVLSQFQILPASLPGETFLELQIAKDLGRECIFFFVSITVRD